MGENEDKPAGLPCPNSSASFWHSEPSKFLLGYQSEPDLPKEADVVIVGSGITGSSVARFLAEDDRASPLSVVMLEAREACWGATGRNGGHCQPLLYDRAADIGAFEISNVQEVRNYIQTHDVPCEWRDVVGCRSFWNEKVFDAVREEVSILQKNHPELGKHVSETTDESIMRQHRVKIDAAGITLTQGAGSLWPYKLVAFILEQCIAKKQLKLFTNTPVTHLEKSSKGQILHTPRGSIQARNVVLATNGYTSHLLPTFIPLIVPIRCEMSALHPPAGSSRLPSSYGFVAAKGQSVTFDDYLIQRPFHTGVDGKPRGGHLMFGGGRGMAEYPCRGETDDDIVDQGEAAYLRKTLPEVLDLGGDCQGELKASHQWTGIKGYSKDNAPWVGKVPDTNGLWLCAGYSGHGMPNATLCGKAIAQMVLAELDGADYTAVCDELVRSQKLPKSYVLTPQRIETAARLPSVRIQEEEAAMITAGGTTLRTREAASTSTWTWMKEKVFGS